MDLALKDLSYYTGTEQYHYWEEFNCLERYFTDGINYVCENGYELLITDIYCDLLELEEKKIISYNDFIYIFFKKNIDNLWTFYILRQKKNINNFEQDDIFSYSDILLEKSYNNTSYSKNNEYAELKLYYSYCGLSKTDKVLYLSSEY